MRVGIVNQKKFKLGYRVKDLYLSNKDFKVIYQEEKKGKLFEVQNLDIIHVCSISLNKKKLLNILLPLCFKTLPSLIILHGSFEKSTSKYLKKKLYKAGLPNNIIFIPYFNYSKLSSLQLKDSVCVFYDSDTEKKLATELFHKFNFRIVFFKDISKGELYSQIFQLKLSLFSAVDLIKDMFLPSELAGDKDYYHFRSYFNYLGLESDPVVMLIDYDSYFELDPLILKDLKLKNLKKFINLLTKLLKEKEKKDKRKFLWFKSVWAIRFILLIKNLIKGRKNKIIN